MVSKKIALLLFALSTPLFAAQTALFSPSKTLLKSTEDQIIFDLNSIISNMSIDDLLTLQSFANTNNFRSLLLCINNHISRHTNFHKKNNLKESEIIQLLTSLIENKELDDLALLIQEYPTLLQLSNSTTNSFSLLIEFKKNGRSYEKVFMLTKEEATALLAKAPAIKRFDLA